MPASGRFLLDTNIVIALLDGDEAVLSNLDRPEVFIPAVALGELFSSSGAAAQSSQSRFRPPEAGPWDAIGAFPLPRFRRPGQAEATTASIARWKTPTVCPA